MENKQTALEWLQEEIDNKDMGEIPMWIYEFIEQAKAMEKEQIEESFKHGRLPIMFGSFQAKDYYKQTYGKETDSN
jgi:hypothetical protein